MHYLGVDMGGSATRWVCCDAEGRIRAEGVTPGATGLVFSDEARRVFLAALEPIRAALPGPVTRAVLGLTGVGLDADPSITALIAQGLGLDAAQVTFCNDMVLAWHAAFSRTPGHLVSAGTGSVGLSVDDAGRVTLVGGRGTLIDDAGSGAWIALRALDAVYRRIDAHGAATGAEVLARHLFAAMGGDDWDTTRRFVYGAERGALGLLAAPVAAAAHAGDPVALDLMARAGQELARLARALLARCGPAPVAVVGGVLALHPLVRTTMIAQVPDAALDFPILNAAARAADLARGPLPKDLA